MTPQDYLRCFHQHCQQRFHALRDIVAQSQWQHAQQACHDFCVEMDSHFVDEEQVLYPVYEQASGQTKGPTEVMRYEHDQMRELMEAMYQAICRQQGRSFDLLADGLQQLLHQHHVKEESILPPYCQPAVLARMTPLAGVRRGSRGGA